jgi:hypothetical protein
MKKSILLLTILFALNSCNKNPQKIAEDNIAKYLAKHLNDPKSYQPDSFGKLDSIFSSFYDTKEGIELMTAYGDLGKDMREVQSKIYSAKSISDLDKIEEQEKIFSEKRDSISELMDEKELKYKGNLTGFRTTHSYRAKNKMGALVLEENAFLLDKDLEVIRMR